MTKEFYLSVEGNEFSLRNSKEYVTWVRRLNRKVEENVFDGYKECRLDKCVKKNRKTFIYVGKSYVFESWLGEIDRAIVIELFIYVDLKEKKI